MKSTRWNAFAAVVLVAVIAVFALVAQWAEPSSEHPSHGARSAAPTGRLALFLLTQELGFRAEAWSDTPAKLPRGESVVWLAASPKRWLSSGEATERSAPAEDGLGRHALAHYRRFVEEGGTLVLPWDDGAKEFLTSGLSLAEFASLSSVANAADSSITVRTSAGETRAVAGELLPCFEGLDPNSELRAVWMVERAGAPESVAAVAASVGSGVVVVLAGDGWLDNDPLASRDHALLAIDLLREFDRGGRLLFDEYALGAWTPPTAVGLATSGMLVAFTLHLVLLFAFFAWRSAWIGPFARDPEALAEVSALSRARVLASLFERAGRRATLARMLRGGVVRTLVPRAARAPLPPSSSKAAASASAASPSSSSSPSRSSPSRRASEDEIEAWMRVLGAQRAVDLDRWREVLSSDVDSPEALERLARDLRRLEERWKQRLSARILRA